jgi:hypothetical protein
MIFRITQKGDFLGFRIFGNLTHQNGVHAIHFADWQLSVAAAPSWRNF